MKIYLAASFRDQAYMRTMRAALVDRGHAVTSAWLDVAGTGMFPEDIQSDIPRAQEMALMDIRGIRVADTIAVFTGGSPSTTGGLHVELGVGIGLRKKVVIVGPRTNIFHTIPLAEHFPSEAEFLDFAERAGKNAA